VRRLRAANPGKVVEVWAEDEARLGLKPITRRVWWLKGHRPRSCGRTKYEWLYVYGFARPRTGDTFTTILPRVNVERMAETLVAFAAHADPDGNKVLVLVVDNAGWHTAGRLAVPANVRLHFLPPCTPELQPVEPFWALVREAVANDTFDRLADLRRRVTRRCGWLGNNTDTVKGAVGFRWAIKLET
jgi:transposase